MYKFTVVTAVYNVEKYLTEMLSSLVNQSIGFEDNIKLVLVNDGSTDASGIICDEWAKDFPNNIIVIHKSNGGQASARNEGLKHAVGGWVTFIDSDDFVHKDYFLTVHQELTKKTSKEIDAVSCRFVKYVEEKRIPEYTHPLEYRFNKGKRISIFDEKCNDIQLNVNSLFLNASSLISKKIIFNEMRAKGEDLLFVAEYFLEIGKPKVLFLPNAKYYYRIRQDQTSTLDQAWLEKELYTLYPKYCLDLIEKAMANRGYLPRWLQRTFVYHHSWEIRRFLNNYSNTAKVPAGVSDKYEILLRSIFSKMDKDIILSFELSGLNFIHRFIMLALKNSGLSLTSDVKAVWWDKDQNMICLRYYFTEKELDLRVKIGDKDVKPVYKKIRTHEYLNNYITKESISWYLWESSEKISYEVNGREIYEKNGDKQRIIEQFEPVKRNVETSFEDLICIKISQADVIRQKYKKAWLLIDRDTQADDNAEHLYRWIVENKKNINIWFALRRNSPDWNRLSKDGFNLVEFGSLQYKILLLNAEHLISSHADNYIVGFLDKKIFSDYLNYKFTFLQHGVIKNDLSQWLNGKVIYNFIVSSEEEYKSIAGCNNRYKFTPKEVFLTGLPRHDYLHRNKYREPNKQILIMPTWRKGLVKHLNGSTSQRVEDSEFSESRFYKKWVRLLKSEQFKELLEEFNYSCVFFLHANFGMYASNFKEKGVTILNHERLDSSIQELFLRSDVLITDYSSVAFEMAYLERPVIYYQFDDNEMFGGNHTTRKGYFDYSVNGFGPVCKTETSLILELTNMLSNNCQLEKGYRKNATTFFKYRDGKCSERVFNVINR